MDLTWTNGYLNDIIGLEADVWILSQNLYL